MQQQPHEQISGIGSSVDDLISSVTNQTQAGATNGTPPTTEAPVERKPKKEKDKNSRLVFSDNETSPEEKMARLSRYAFTPNKKEETVLGNVTAEVTGIVAGPDDVVDKSS